MNVTDFSITIFFNQKGIDKRLTIQMDSLIVFRDFLKQNFPNLLNNLGQDKNNSMGGNNSIKFDDYRVSFDYYDRYITIGLIDCKEINTLQENKKFL